MKNALNSKSFSNNSRDVSNDTNLEVSSVYANTPIATRTIKLATVFIGICTAADSEIFKAINYLSRPAVNQSINLFHKLLTLSQALQQIFLHLFIIFFLLNFVKEVVRVFCSPLPTIFYIPLVRLYFPIWNLIFNCKRRYVPN